MSKQQHIAFIIIVFAALTLVIFILYDHHVIFQKQYTYYSINDPNFMNACAYPKMSDSVACVNNFISQNYKYVNNGVLDSQLNYSLSYIILNGGRCIQYTTLQKQWIDNINSIEKWPYYDSKIISYQVTSITSHAYLEVYNSDYHCIIDENEQSCWERSI